MPLPKCSQCHKPLSDPVSVSQGIGPDCLASRAKYLAAAGASETELRDWAASTDPTLQKWARLTIAACGNGNQKHVDNFVAAGRRRAEMLALPVAA